MESEQHDDDNVVEIFILIFVYQLLKFSLTDSKEVSLYNKGNSKVDGH